MTRKLRSEKRERHFDRNGVPHWIEYSWHYLNSGERYHFIHVYRVSPSRLPFRWWRWVTDDENNFIDWV